MQFQAHPQSGRWESGSGCCSVSASGLVCIAHVSLILRITGFLWRPTRSESRARRPGCTQRRKNRKACAFIEDPLPREWPRTLVGEGKGGRFGVSGFMGMLSGQECANRCTHSHGKFRFLSGRLGAFFSMTSAFI
jgi:hypothetical protein